MVKAIKTARQKLQRHGVLNTVYELTLKALHSACGFKILRGVYVEKPDPSFLKYPEKYTAGFLTTTQLRDYARDPRTELSDTFLDASSARGDECYALQDGTNLAAYGWYSYGSTPVGLPDLVLKFSTDYVYMYKGFTDTAYRGQRLHAIGMTRALAHYVSSGFKGIVSYVEAQNFDSLKSCFRMGYSVFGSIYIVRFFGRDYAFSSPGCRRFDFRLARVAERAAVTLTFGKN